jgi:hypothetical protein
MNERIKELEKQSLDYFWSLDDSVRTTDTFTANSEFTKKFAELIVRECINREALLGAIARGWCSEKNSHKEMDSDLALAIFDEVEKQIRKHFGVEE